MSATTLGERLAATRRRRGLSLRAAAGEIGTSFATVNRVEQGGECNCSTGLRIAEWITGPIEGMTPEDAYRCGWDAAIDTTLETVRELRYDPGRRARQPLKSSGS